MNYCCHVYDEVDTDEDDKMTLKQSKDRHKKHVDDEEVGSDEDDKMPLTLLKDRRKKHGNDEEVGSDEDDKMPLTLLKDRCKKHGDDEVDSDADDKMTLGKLKDTCKSKKRELISHPDTSRKQEDVNFQSDEDDDLNAHLSFSKSKLTKSSKAKMRCIKRHLFGFPKTVMSVKTEQVRVSDVPIQLKEDSPLFSNIKAEIPEPEFFGSQISNLLVDSSSSEVSMLLKEHSLPQVKVKTETFESESFGQKSSKTFIGRSPVCCHEGSSSAKVISSEVAEIVERKLKTSIQVEEQQYCMLNAMSYEHLKYLDPESSPKSHGDMHPNNLKKSFDTEVDMQSHPHGGFLETISFPRDKNLDVHSHQHEFAEQRNCLESHISDTIIANKDGFTNNYDSDDICISEDEVACTNLGSHVSDTVLANKVGCTNHSTVSPFKKCIASGDSHSCSNTDNNLESVEGTTTYEDQLSNCCSADPTNGCLDPGNAYTGKFPTACKLKRKHTESKHPAEHPQMASSSIDKNSKLSTQVCQAKVTIDPNETAKRLKKRRKGSPPHGNLECHNLSQSLPKFSTGCTSVQHFSASAIAFSERQMHDIESLAVKLMKELNSMKDIVEGQLQFQACSSASLKNEVDKVRVAIHNANKAEEKAKRLLYMMNRDCIRFCKLMEISQNDAAPSKDTAHKARKITFADEAGGILCHVNYISDAMISKQSDDGKQEN
nr:uncharacterized protein LOC109149563 [Ipomoea batatas]